VAIETERKFKVSGDGWRDGVSRSFLIEQGYFLAERGRSGRVRIRTLLTDDGSAEPECFLTLKFGEAAISTEEFEYSIPYADARKLFGLCGDMTLSKVRHHVPFDGRTWEVDEFRGRHDGLVVAEVEGDDAESINNFPAWLGTEVTYDSYFKNASLVSAK